MASRPESSSRFSPVTIGVLVSVPLGTAVGAALAPMITTASAVGGAMCGGLFVGTTLFTVFVLTRTCLPGREHRVMQFALGIIAAHLAGMFIPTLLGFPMTFSAVARIDFCLFGVIVGIICGRECARGTC